MGVLHHHTPHSTPIQHGFRGALQFAVPERLPEHGPEK